MKKNAVKYPNKTTINLVIKEKTSLRPTRSIPLIAVVIVVVLLFGKFAVADQLQRIADEQAKLAAVNAQHAQLEAATADFEAVSAKYIRYASGWRTEDERILPDRLAAIELIEGTLMKQSPVLNYSIQGDQISASLDGLTLGDTSQLLKKLNAIEIVKDVDVFTASTDKQLADDAAIAIVITLEPAEVITPVEEAPSATAEGGAAE